MAYCEVPGNPSDAGPDQTELSPIEAYCQLVPDMLWDARDEIAAVGREMYTDYAAQLKRMRKAIEIIQECVDITEAMTK